MRKDDRTHIFSQAYGFPRSEEFGSYINQDFEKKPSIGKQVSGKIDDSFNRR